MKQFIFIFSIAAGILFSGCEKDNDETINYNTPEKYIVKGRVTDTHGNAMAHVKVTIEDAVFLAHYVNVETDSQGYYITTVPNGSWKASAILDKNYQGNIYKFDLHPDNAGSFAGQDGAIRNFSWKLSGQNPGGGYYGENVAVYSEPGSVFNMSDVEITLTPDGPIVDGSIGQPVTRQLIDIGGGEDGINDVPLGKYMITAKNLASGQPLEIRLRNEGNYESSLTANFSTGFTGLTTYQIVAQVR
ncbi:MAG: carboxypeptidase-like regulatory domain-containing protein [Ferruginibacter sp.]